MSFIHYFSPNENSFDFSQYDAYIKRNFIGQTPFFISDWDSPASVYHLDTFISNSVGQAITNIDHYYSCNNNECQQKIAEYISQNYNWNINPQQIIIGNNATSLLSFCIQTLLYRGAKNYLAIAPVYFSTIDSIKLGNANIIIFQPTFPDLIIDMEELIAIVRRNDIDAIIITDPYFGFGKQINIIDFMKILSIAQEYDCTVICDFARYGLEWLQENENLLFNEKLEFFQNNNKFILIYSPCKKYFANGIKTAIMITSPDMISTTSDYADSVLGSISSFQMFFLEALLSKSNNEIITDKLIKNKNQIIHNYELLTSCNLDKQLRLVKPDMGNYMVWGIKKNTNDFEMFRKILEKINVSTLPLSLYHFFESNEYIFRVNLLLDSGSLLYTLEKLHDLQYIF